MRPSEKFDLFMPPFITVMLFIYTITAIDAGNLALAMVTFFSTILFLAISIVNINLEGR